MTQTVVISIRANPGLMWNSWNPAIALLKEAGFRVIDGRAPVAVTPEQMKAQVAEAEALITGLEPVDASVLEAGPRLKFVGKPGTGVDNIDVPEATRRGIMVCNTAGSNAEAVADHTFALILALLRRTVYLDQLTRAGRGWDKWPPVVGAELWQRKIGIVGVGAIGRGVARRARGFDMTIIGYDVAADEGFAQQVGLMYRPLDALLAEADIVTIHVPLVLQTEGLIGATELATMKKGAYLVNMARGPVVVEEALVEALRLGRLAGAALDVFEQEPPADDNPLFEFENVVLSPHVAGFSEEAVVKSRVWLAEAARDALQGKVPRTLVNSQVLQQD
jgi:D-3-phosphoglycerate dehydrogenase